MIDGAMGTMIQSHKLEEEDFRGEEKGRVGSHNCLITTGAVNFYGPSLKPGPDWTGLTRSESEVVVIESIVW